VDALCSYQQILKDRGVNRRVLALLLLIHLGGLASLGVITWQGVVLCVTLYFATGMGVTLGNHRLFTHASYKCAKWLRYSLAVLGQLSGEGSIIHWVAVHNLHHQESDKIGDPHSPRYGLIWSHIKWLLVPATTLELNSLFQRNAKYLMDDLTLKKICRRYGSLHVLLGLLILGISYAIWRDWYITLSCVMWGMFARLMFVLHSTWMVNSVSHVQGYKNYATDDDSKNSVVVALVAHGEGWHNNHHARASAANHGFHRWWEIDITFIVIVLLGLVGKLFGLLRLRKLRPVWDVQFYSRRRGKTLIWFH